jgi:hypothetical protein
MSEKPTWDEFGRDWPFACEPADHSKDHPSMEAKIEDDVLYIQSRSRDHADWIPFRSESSYDHFNPFHLG